MVVSNYHDYHDMSTNPEGGGGTKYRLPNYPKLVYEYITK